MHLYSYNYDKSLEHSPCLLNTFVCLPKLLIESINVVTMLIKPLGHKKWVKVVLTKILIKVIMMIDC